MTSNCNISNIPARYDIAAIKFQFVALTIIVTFLYPNKKVTKEVVRGEAFRANSRNYGALATGKRPILIRCAEHHLAPDPTPAAFDHRPLKMSRFSAGSAEQSCRFAKCKRSKIGTFLNAGWRCGGWILKEGAFARSASLSRLLLVLFLPKQEKYGYLISPINCNLTSFYLSGIL